MFTRVDPRQLGAGRAFDELSRPPDIVALLKAISAAGAPVFVARAGEDDALLTRIARVESDGRGLCIADVASAAVPVSFAPGDALEVFVATGDADVFFDTRVLEAEDAQAGVHWCGLPALVRRLRRRASRRGQGFASWGLVLRKKGTPAQGAPRARLRDISREGVGFSLPRGAAGVEVGAVLDDCLVLAGEMPVVACALEILHARDDPAGGIIVAGGRFLALDEQARTRIEKLVDATRLEDASAS